MTDSQSNGAGMSDEMLMAYVDGELGSEEAQAVERAAAGDPSLAARIATYRHTREAAQAAFAGVLKAQPPERLVAPLRPGTRRGPLMSRGLALPLAASLVLAVGIGGFLAGRFTTPAAESLAARAGSPAVVAALSHQPSGVPIEVEGARLTATGTFPAGDGLCRSFMFEAANEALRGVACNAGAGWKTGLLVAAPTGETAATASGSAAAAVEGYLDAAGAGPALEPAEEARRLGR